MIIINSFSLAMLPSLTGRVHLEEVSLDTVKFLALGGFRSAVGHADTARLFSSLLGFDIMLNRANITLAEGEQMLVGQYTGGRLPEGTTTLPEGATIRWVLVRWTAE